MLSDGEAEDVGRLGKTEAVAIQWGGSSARAKVGKGEKKVGCDVHGRVVREDRLLREGILLKDIRLKDLAWSAACESWYQSCSSGHTMGHGDVPLLKNVKEHTTPVTSST